MRMKVSIYLLNNLIFTNIYIFLINKHKNTIKLLIDHY